MKSRKSIAIATVTVLLVLGWTLWRSPPPADQLLRDAMSRLERGQVIEAEALFDQMQQFHPAARECQVLKGGLLFHSGKYADALQVLDPSLATDSLREPVLAWASECFVKLGDLARAEPMLRTLVTEFPNNEHATRLLVVLYYDLGAMHPVLVQLDRLKRLARTDYRSERMAGMIYQDFEQYDLAVPNYRAALLKEPPAHVRDQITLELAQTLRKQLKYAESLVTLATLARSAESLTEKALNELSLGDLVQAEQTIAEAKALNEEIPSLLRAESQLLFEQRQFEPAIISIKKLLKIEPHDSQLQYQLSQAFQALGRQAEYAEALARFESMLALRTRLTELSNKANDDPFDEATRVELATVCHKLGRYDLEKVWQNAARVCREASAMHGKLKPQHGRKSD